jgi:hypothetical protein
MFKEINLYLEDRKMTQKEKIKIINKEDMGTSLQKSA